MMIHEYSNQTSTHYHMKSISLLLKLGMKIILTLENIKRLYPPLSLSGVPNKSHKGIGIGLGLGLEFSDLREVGLVGVTLLTLGKV